MKYQSAKIIKLRLLEAWAVSSAALTTAFMTLAAPACAQNNAPATPAGGPAAPAGAPTAPGANAPGTASPTAAPTASTGTAAGQAGSAGQNATGMVGTIAAQDSGPATGMPATSGSVITGENGSPGFDLAHTIDTAIRSSAALIEAQRNVEIDRKRADEVAGQSRPTLSADGSATRFDQATKIAFGPQKVTVLGTHSEALSLIAADRIDLLGIVRAQTSQARLQSLADTFTLTAIQNERALQAQTIYFTLLRAIHQVSVAQTTLRNAHEQQQVANRLYLGQIGQKIDLLRANTQVATAEQNLAAAQNNREIARASFNDLVGRPLTAPVYLQDVPGVNVGVDITTAASGTPASPTAQTTIGTPPSAEGFVPFSAPTTEIAAIDVTRSITNAQAVRPEVLQQAILVRASDIGVRIARSGLEPSFSISASGNYYPTPSFQYPRQRTGALTLSMSIPLYDGGITRDRIAEARLRTQNAQTALDSTREDIALQVRQSYLNMSTAARQIDAADAALQQAIAARQLAQVRYEGQVGIYLEVTDAQAALVQAENSQVDAVYNYFIARAQFENALGAPRTSAAAATSGARINLPSTAPAMPTQR